ncbi:unnamed protein product [Brassica rapa subsp. trilocularis]|uniref:(rape) hypothetical protein n=1 Tax=Brassica napus TaxID=3708 RepID=A0A816TEM3_BRANA|nr:unnamed protein product [Brassica napus]
MKCWRREKDKDKARKCFLENRSMFLEQLIADCNGISNPIRMFSSDQISEATNQFDPMCSLQHISSYFTWYKGIIEGRSYVIKRFIDPVVGEEERAYSDIALSARIAKEVVTAITYLHTAFSRIILHRDIKATNVFLDKNWKASLTDFSSAVTLPEGKSWIQGIVLGTMLLDYVKDLRERGEPVEFGGDSKDMRPGQMNMFLDLALRCCEVRNEDRPKMILVAKEIKLIEQASL